MELEASVAREKLARLQKTVEECVDRLGGGGEDEFEVREGCLELVRAFASFPSSEFELTSALVLIDHDLGALARGQASLRQISWHARGD